MKKMYYFKVGDIVETLNGSSKAIIIRIEHSTMWIQWLGKDRKSTRLNSSH